MLQNGQTINKINDDVTTFSFTQSTLNMSSHDSSIIKVDKIQETSTLNLFICLNRFLNFYKNNSKDKKSEFIQNCTIENLDNVFKELYKRILVPFYIPILVLISLMLVLYSKESINYTRFRIVIFLVGFSIIIFSETTQKLVNETLNENIIIFIFPLLIFVLFYLSIIHKLNFKYKINNKLK